ncbi:hypothetical protein ES708_14583 [subsurface metagenome]
MQRYRLQLLAIIVLFVFSACDTFDPQWIGIWVDDSTVENVKVILDLGKDEGTVRVENSDPTAEISLTIVDGSLEGDEDTITATITYLYAEENDPPAVFETKNRAMIEAYLRTLGVGRTNSCSYTIEGDTLTITGQLILVLTTNESDTLTAVK